MIVMNDDDDDVPEEALGAVEGRDCANCAELRGRYQYKRETETLI